MRRILATAAMALLLAGVALVPVLAPQAQAAGSLNCSASFRIDETLPSGGRWQMCWELRSLEGVVLHGVTYTPPGGDAIEVLGAMNLAQIHVPYDNNVARFHDESDYGLGNNLQSLALVDCPGGDLLSDGSQNVLCQQVQPIGYNYKKFDQQAQGDTLSLFSVSAIGSYNYVIAWNFDDDGTIRPAVGATGALQMYGGNRATGWDVGEHGFAVAHMHNFYWRLDFDLGGADNDRVQELSAVQSADHSQFTNTRRPFMTEAARHVLPRQFRSWRVLDTAISNADGHRISYELHPNTDYIFHGTSYEPFSQNQFYATQLNPCERFASHNPTEGGCADNLASFVNGASLVGADVVVWYGTSFHHLPRDEDETHMDAHWSTFSITPRDLTATYPIP